MAYTVQAVLFQFYTPIRPRAIRKTKAITRRVSVRGEADLPVYPLRWGQQSTVNACNDIIRCRLFEAVFNAIVCICHHLLDSRIRNVHDLDLDLDHSNGSTANVNMPFERSYSRFYFISIVIFAKSLSMYEIFALETCAILIMTFKMAKIKYKYDNRKPRRHFLFDGNSNACPISHYLMAIAMLARSLTIWWQ